MGWITLTVLPSTCSPSSSARRFTTSGICTFASSSCLGSVAACRILRPSFMPRSCRFIVRPFSGMLGNWAFWATHSFAASVSSLLSQPQRRLTEDLSHLYITRTPDETSMDLRLQHLCRTAFVVGHIISLSASSISLRGGGCYYYICLLSLS